MRKLPVEQRKRVCMLLRFGFSLREVHERTGVSKPCVFNIANQLGTVNNSTKAKLSCASDPSAKQCQNCGLYFVGVRESDRRTSRCKHTFCSIACYGDFRRRLKDGDCCKRCGKQRGKVWGRVMCRGYCGTCYGLLRQYGWNESLVQFHELARTLSKEIKHADQQHK